MKIFEQKILYGHGSVLIPQLHLKHTHASTRKVKDIQVNYNNKTYQTRKAMCYHLCDGLHHLQKVKLRLIPLIIVFHLSRNFPTKNS